MKNQLLEKFIHLLKLSLLLCLLPYAVHAQTLSLSDGDFSSWTVFHVNTDDPFIAGTGPNTSTGSGQRLATGGDPGPYLQLQHTFNSGDASFIGGIKTDYSYTPATQGALTTLSLGADVEASGASGSAAYQLVLQQGGQRYYSYPFAGFSTPTSFIHVTLSNLAAGNFDTNPFAGVGGVTPDGNQPNFTSTGTAIQFGFAFGNRVIGSGSLTTTFGLDNVTVVPEPGSFALLVAAAPIIFVLRRRIARSRA